jgi:hypothetical protein
MCRCDTTHSRDTALQIRILTIVLAIGTYLYLYPPRLFGLCDPHSHSMGVQSTQWSQCNVLDLAIWHADLTHLHTMGSHSQL